MKSNEATVVLDEINRDKKSSWRLLLWFAGNLFFGLLSFILSLGIQMNLYLFRMTRAKSVDTIDVSITSIGIGPKVVLLTLAFFGLFCGYQYWKSGDKKMRIVNLFGLMLGFFSVLLILVPIYRYL